MENSKQAGKCGRRKMLMGLNAWAGVLLAFILLLMVNYFAHRHGFRFSIQSDRSNLLSPATVDILADIDKEVDIIVFFRPSSELYSRIKLMLREYEFASENIRLAFIDPDRDLARAEGLGRRYEVSDANVVVVACGQKKQIIRENELAEYEYAPGSDGETRRILSFLGEQAFSSAIYEVIQETRPVVYFLAGHGERQIDDYDRHKGCSGVARLLRREGMEVRALELGKAGRVPEDCGVIVVPGPRKKLAVAEMELIHDYLADGGKAMFMFDSDMQTGLEELLLKWGVKVGKDRVFGMTLTGYELLVTSYGEHEITEKLDGYTTIFNVPCSVEPADIDAADFKPADRPKVMVLASGEWAETNPEQSPPIFDPEEDRKGPVPVAVAVEKGSPSGVELQINPTRLVVTGDSTMICNGAIAAGYNLDFFLNSIKWLLGRQTSLAIQPAREHGVRVILSRGRSQTLFWMLTAGIPLVAAALGFLIWARRRK